MIRNYYDWHVESDGNSHGGEGQIQIQKVFRRVDFSTGWDFALRVVMPVGSSMGVHEHGDNEEMYIILTGSGLMTLSGQQRRVKPGDMILNKPHGAHGLVNDGPEPLELLIIQASLDRANAIV